MTRSTILRTAVLCACIGIILVLYLCSLFVPVSLPVNALNQAYGDISFVLLYVSMLISPAYGAIYQLPYKAEAVMARRAIGVGSCLFALAHTWVSVEVSLGGIGGIAYLPKAYESGVVTGFIALGILLVLTATSLDAAVRLLSSARWKWLHRLTYVAGLLVLVHVAVIGSNFSDHGALPFALAFIATVGLWLLEGLRIEKALIARKVPFRYARGLHLVMAAVVGISFAVASGHLKGVHADHHPSSYGK